ncbi:DUF4190 domain-containing protein [Salinibacterium sp. NG253]|uniref:DUF4190 domain-containing protein n=1 Tax=unclassified Salinibacterium TaxID=2632331 RepID=UPI0018CDB05E|nr:MULTISPECIES: DUF4190 domain-containing protein [unclassified Salinibacterium]MBH0024643.1 DUF4190 domain-containing protein [Salinibacterium sp. SWN248]MBH0110620.1 DUF4190 domain-containing protein [Salinibacterium sp. NG22]MBH0117578.1 DUF4190 domain-containing protein [Salinibacterium sp. NG253]
MTTSPVPRTNTLALIGFIAAFMIPIVGVVLGAMGRKQITSSGESGRGLARAAIIIGIAGTLFQVAFFAVWLTIMTAGLTQSGLLG